MPWVRVDDHFDEHPKMARVGPLGWALWLAGLAYCNRNLTDGFIPWNVAKKLVSWEFLSTRENTGKTHAWSIDASTGSHTQEVDGEFVINLLLENGLWTEVEDGYVIHDFSEYQPTRADVLTERKKWADRQAKSRDKSRRDSPEESRAESREESGVGHTRPVPVPVPVGSSLGSTTPTGSVGRARGLVAVDAREGA